MSNCQTEITLQDTSKFGQFRFDQKNDPSVHYLMEFVEKTTLYEGGDFDQWLEFARYGLSIMQLSTTPLSQIG
jgi:hypothetical protein